MASEQYMGPDPPAGRRASSPGEGFRRRAVRGMSNAARFSGRAARYSGRATAWIALVVVVLAILVIVASLFVDEPLRRRIEAGMNRKLRGYTARVPKLHFSLFDAGVTLHDVTVRQNANPEPPVI